MGNKRQQKKRHNTSRYLSYWTLIIKILCTLWVSVDLAFSFAYYTQGNVRHAWKYLQNNSQVGATLPSLGHFIWQYLRHFWLSQLGRGCYWHWVGWEARDVRSVLECTGWGLTSKDYLAQNVDYATVEKSCCRETILQKMKQDLKRSDRACRKKTTLILGIKNIVGVVNSRSDIAREATGSWWERGTVILLIWQTSKLRYTESQRLACWEINHKLAST